MNARLKILTSEIFTDFEVEFDSANPRIVKKDNYEFEYEMFEIETYSFPRLLTSRMKDQTYPMSRY